MDLMKLIEKYLESFGCKAKTIENFRERLSLFIRWLNAQNIDQAHELSEALIKDYQAYLISRELSNNSRYVYLSELKRFLDFLFNRDYLFIRLGQGIALPSWERKKKPTLSKAEIKTAIERISDQEPVKTRNQVILALGLYEDIKTGDIANLSVIDINLEEKEIRLTNQKRFKKIQTETSVLLKKYLRTRISFKPRVDYLFVKRGGERLDQQSISIVFKEARQ